MHRILCAFVSAAILLLGLTAPAMAQSEPTEDCAFDPDNPRYENALHVFEDGQYACAEHEAALLLSRVLDAPLLQARVFVLLAGVKYYTATDPVLKKAAVKENLLAAYRIYPVYNDDPPVISLEFLIWMDEAQNQVESEISQSEHMQEYRDRLVQQRREALAGGTPWYRKWWVWSLGGTVVAGAVTAVLISGGGDAPRDTLPGFPGPP